MMTRAFLLLLRKYSEVSEASVQLSRESSEPSTLVKPHYSCVVDRILSVDFAVQKLAYNTNSQLPQSIE